MLMSITPIRKQDRLESRPHADCVSISSVRRPTDAIGDTLVTFRGDARLIAAAASEAGPDTLSRRTAFVTALPTRPVPPYGGAVEGAMQGFDDCFAALQDPRGVNARRHDLWEILMIALCAVLSGGQTAVDMAVFAEAKQEFLGNFLQLKNGVPSHDTFSRVFRPARSRSVPCVFSALHGAFQRNLNRGHRHRWQGPAQAARPCASRFGFAYDQRLVLRHTLGACPDRHDSQN
jgi:DDE_Tnp_1-associated